MIRTHIMSVQSEHLLSLENGRLLQSSRHNALEIQTICANVANFCGNGFNNTRGLDGETASKKANQKVAES